MSRRVPLILVVSFMSCGEPEERAVSSQPLAASALPGRIEAESYLPTRDVGFHDTTVGNAGAVFRTDDVDLQACSDVSGGYNVGWIAPGEWLAFDVSAKQTGVFAFSARVASALAGTKSLHLSIDGVAQPSATFTLADGWQKWSSIEVARLRLSAGAHRLVVFFDAGTTVFNFNALDATLVCAPLSCASAGKNCGSLDDGCGGTLSCGSCAMPQTCGGTGIANVCGAPKLEYSPGHYLLLSGIAGTAAQLRAIDQAFSERAFLDRFAGVQVLPEWPELEAARGVYTFEGLHAVATRVAEKNAALGTSKKLVIQLQYHQWGAGSPTPAYIGTCSTPGCSSCGTFVTSPTESHVKFWNPRPCVAGQTVLERFEGLLTALAAEHASWTVDERAVLNGFVFPETACANCQNDGDFTLAGYTNSMKHFLQTTRRLFPKKMVFQYVNFMPGGGSSDLCSLVTDLLPWRVGVGIPDVRAFHKRGPDDCTRLPYDPPGYQVIRAFKGRVASNLSVQPTDYMEPERYSTAFSVGMSDLGANYFVWQNVTATTGTSCASRDFAFNIRDVYANVPLAFANTNAPTWTAPLSCP